MVKVATKTCSKCHACKPVHLFRKKRNKCKACEVAKAREYYHNNKEKIAAEKREYYQNNKEKIKARDREYRQQNKGKIDAKNREYNKGNRVKINDRRRKRRKNDPKYNLICRLRTRMNRAVKAAGLDKKCDSSSELLGISYQGLKEWLQAQFTEGMTWENRSDWHVDHRVPCDAFDLSDETNQRICFWYKNLQPMWAKDNMQKSNTYTEEEKNALMLEYYKKERI